MFEQWLEDARLKACGVVVRDLWTRPNRHDLAEEASAQASYEAVRLGEDHFPGGQEQVIGWVITAAKNRARDTLTSAWQNRRLPLDGERAPKVDDVSLEMDAIREECGEAIQRALEAIGSPCREILVLRFWNGLSDMAIAEQLVGDQATDADRQRIWNQRRNCLSDMRRRLLADGIDPGAWW